MKYKDIIVLLASSFFLILAWVIFNIYHNSVVSTTPEDLIKETLPINPTFDQSTINKLNSRTKISPAYNMIPLTPPESINNAPEITPEITVEPKEIVSEPTISEGGEIAP